MGKSFRKNMDSIWKHMKDNTPTLTTWRNQNQFQCHEKVTSPTGLVITRRSIRVKPSFRNSTSKLGSIEVWVNGEIYMDSASIFWANMLSHKPQSIFWGQNTKSGGDVGGLIWAFMGNLGSVGTSVNACIDLTTMTLEIKYGINELHEILLHHLTA